MSFINQFSHIAKKTNVNIQWHYLISKIIKLFNTVHLVSFVTDTLLMTSYIDPNIFKQQDNELSLCE